jgi:succinyl-CoA synthetase beta subunit
MSRGKDGGLQLREEDSKAIEFAKELHAEMHLLRASTIHRVQMYLFGTHILDPVRICLVKCV